MAMLADMLPMVSRIMGKILQYVEETCCLKNFYFLTLYMYMYRRICAVMYAVHKIYN